MEKLSEYELEKINDIEKELNKSERILLRVFKRYTYKVYQIGFRDKYFKK